MNALNNNYTKALLAAGFVPQDHGPHHSRALPGVYYAMRKNDNLHEYVSLVFFSTKFVLKSQKEMEELEPVLTDEDFCEGLWELYVVPKNTRVKGNPKPLEQVKKGFTAVLTGVSRNLSELAAFTQKTHETNQFDANRLVAEMELRERQEKSK